MEKISLYDKDTDKIYDITLSREDAYRAKKDIAFATSLLNATIMDKTITEQTEELSEDLDTQFDSMSEISDINNDFQSTADNNEEGSLYRWPEASVLLLLRIHTITTKKFT
ncbi:PREDICTED: uncharacterized protein LOC105448121 [Wasmannia auropunctata]|uniref:uncharacterized protein LOC105448121 n=1 Tax=Wasmannia auropunctata TaxID=64793 RepID=UPI0005F09DCC|nr:PREDICTED: uncharacterized protein LOC105448121 [Wasmannia auropunctata]